MPAARIISQTGTGQTGWVNPNWLITPFNVTVRTQVSGSATYNVETTLDNYWTYPVGTVNALINSSGSQVAAGVDIPLTETVTGIRINITSGTGTVTAEILQAGITNM